MAKRELTSTQMKIVDRYYANHDTIQLTKLQELVSELYLAEPGKAAEKLWKRAEQALNQTKAEPSKVQTVLASRDSKAFAVLVERLVKTRS